MHSGRYDLVFKVKSVASEETWNKLLLKRTYGLNYVINLPWLEENDPVNFESADEQSNED
jgi:hypothetical protein